MPTQPCLNNSTPTHPPQDMKGLYERELQSVRQQLAALRTQASSAAADESFLREEARLAAAQRDKALQQVQAVQRQVRRCQVHVCMVCFEGWNH